MEFQTDEHISSESEEEYKSHTFPSLSFCQNCDRMMKEIIDLRIQIGKYQEAEKKAKKHFTIAPTLYTFYKDRLDKRQLVRMASIESQPILQSHAQCDYGFLEDLINKCSSPLPNPFFSSMEFAEQFIFECDEMCRILSSEPRLLRLQSPSYVFGDIHGNMTDLLSFAKNLWPLGMHLTPGSFLFLGDYVDRGMFSLEVLSYIFAQKIMLPEKVFLLRGNHEVRIVNGCDSYYGNKCLLGQLKERFPIEIAVEIWHRVNNVFNCLPLAATIDDVIFCVHGGIPRPINETESFSISRINLIPSPYELTPVSHGQENAIICQLVTDLLWSDPAREQQEAFLDANGFGEGERGPGAICYGQKAIEDFFTHNGLTHLFRAHEPTSSGISVRKGAKVITIFSTSKDHNCPNAFCGCILVDGCIIKAINHADIIRSE